MKIFKLITTAIGAALILTLNTTAFAQDTDPKTIVVQCSRILLRMEEGTERNAAGNRRRCTES